MRLEDFDNDEDKVIQDRLKQKTWNEIRTNDSWAIFKIMAEFVDGYEKLAKIGPCLNSNSLTLEFRIDVPITSDGIKSGVN